MNSSLSEENLSPPFKTEQKPGLDLSGTDVRELVLSTGLELKTFQELMNEKRSKKDQMGENIKKLGESQVRRWMIKHNGERFIDFDDKERFKLKQFFSSLDADGSGSIGVDELAEPLISLGIAQNVEEVQKIVDSVDEDHSGQIEFDEFLKIIGNSTDNKGDTGIIDFFKDMISGRLAGGKISNKLPFNLIISTVRRKKLMNAMMSGDPRERGEGEKVMNSYAKLLATQKNSQSYMTEVSPGGKSNKKGRKESDTSDSSFSSRKGKATITSKF